MASERLQKILARGGVASRRAAEQWITSGRVRVNGRVVTELGAKADPLNDKIEVDGTRLVAESFVYLILHKPRGVVATLHDPEGRPTVKELLGGVDARVYPVGRLDFATSGVLLVTNDGAFADGLLHPRKAVPKTYVLKTQGEMSPADVERWRTGVRLEDGMTLPAEASLLRHEAGKTWLELTIREGRNQQIRRMGEATGFRVMRLARTSFAGITSEGLRPGAWRHLTRDELTALRQAYGVPQKLPRPPEETASRRPTSPRGRPRGHAAPRGEPRHEGRGRSEERSAPNPRGRGEGRADTRAPRSDARPSRGSADTRAPRPAQRRESDARAPRADTRAPRPDTRGPSRDSRGGSRPRSR